MSTTTPPTNRAIQTPVERCQRALAQATRALAGELITTTLSAVGKQFSESPRTPAEIETYANAMADMFCAYLTGLAHRGDDQVEPDITG